MNFRNLLSNFSKKFEYLTRKFPKSVLRKISLSHYNTEENRNPLKIKINLSSKRSIIDSQVPTRYRNKFLTSL